MAYQFPYKTSQGTIMLRADTLEELEHRVRIADSIPEEAPINVTDDMSWHEKLRAGIGSGMVGTARKALNLIGIDEGVGDFDTSDEAIRAQAELDRDLTDTGWGKGGQIIGEMAATAPLGLGAGRVVAKALPAATRLRTAAVLGTEGGVEGLVTANPDERLEGLGTGVVLGGTLGAAGDAWRGLRGMSRTRTREEAAAAERLLNRGVDLTPGQARPGGFYHAMEESAGSRVLPGASTARSNAEDQAVTEWINLSRAPGTSKILNGTPDQMADEIAENFNVQYRAFGDVDLDVTGNMVQKNMPDAFQTMAGKAGAKMEDIDRDVRWLVNEISNMPAGRLKFADLHKVRTAIRAKAGALRQTGTADQAERIDALDDLDDLISGLLKRKLTGDQADWLKTLDRQYGKYKVVQSALHKGASRRGRMPTIHQIMTAVNSRRGMSKGRIARGHGLRDDLGEMAADMREVFAQQTPPTGIALALPMSTAAAGSAIGGTMLGPLGAMGGAVGAALPQVAAGVMAGVPPLRRALARSAARYRTPAARFVPSFAGSYARNLGYNTASSAIGGIVDRYSED